MFLSSPNPELFNKRTSVINADYCREKMIVNHRLIIDFSGARVAFLILQFPVAASAAILLAVCTYLACCSGTYDAIEALYPISGGY